MKEGDAVGWNLGGAHICDRIGKPLVSLYVAPCATLDREPRIRFESRPEAVGEHTQDRTEYEATNELGHKVFKNTELRNKERL